MNRRRFLATLGGAAGLSGCSNGSSPSTERPEWERRADRSIRANRTTHLGVVVLDGAGDPLPGADVVVEMQAHDFHFGTAVEADRLRATREGDPYQARLLDNFNTAVLETRHKWRPWETPQKRAVANRATRWLRENGLAVRGHTAIWQDRSRSILPADVLEKLRSDDPNRSGYLARRTDDHVRDIVGNTAKDVFEWDVLNEHLDFHEITEAIAPEHPPQRSPPPVRWFRTAGEVAPNLDFYVNDYGLIAGHSEERSRKLAKLVQHLRGAGVTVDGVGMEGHFGSRDAAVGPAELRDLLDRYASLGVDLKVTEYDTYGPGWTEENEAEHLGVVLKTLFGHPAADGFLVWGFRDADHWQNNAPFFRNDWSAKPAYEVYSDLVFDDWWTSETGVTDENGYFGTRAFLGEHEITATGRGNSRTVTRSVTDPRATPTVVVQL